VAYKVQTKIRLK